VSGGPARRTSAAVRRRGFRPCGPRCTADSRSGHCSGAHRWLPGLPLPVLKRRRLPSLGDPGLGSNPQHPRSARPPTGPILAGIPHRHHGRHALITFAIQTLGTFSVHANGCSGRGFDVPEIGLIATKLRAASSNRSRRGTARRSPDPRGGRHHWSRRQAGQDRNMRRWVLRAGVSGHAGDHWRRGARCPAGPRLSCKSHPRRA
jgi:hypothetical protein